jgi:hypothetical protein
MQLAHQHTGRSILLAYSISNAVEETITGETLN